MRPMTLLGSKRLAFLCVTIPVILSCAPDPGPSDETIRFKFRRCRQAFETLSSMIQTEITFTRIGTDVIGDHWLSETPLVVALETVKLSRKRYDNYIELLSEIGAYHLAFQDGVARFSLYRSGTTPEGYVIDIVRTESPPHPIVSDTVVATRRDNDLAYSNIVEQWYIFREHN